MRQAEKRGLFAAQLPFIWATLEELLQLAQLSRIDLRSDV
jgi:hypothetical protein